MVVLRAWTLAVAAALTFCATAGAAPRPTIAPPVDDRPGVRPFGGHDTERHGIRARTSAERSSLVTARTGETVRIAVSGSYTASPALDQQWADFFAGLPHGPELARLSVYFGTPDEVEELCGKDANACYAPRDEEMILSGDGVNADGSAVEEAARHEYGHHVALAQRNDPWPSVMGTKRWFTGARVCQGLRSGRFVADPEVDYRRSPVEGFAEAFRVAAGGDASWWPIVSSRFKPSPALIELIRRDAAEPWRPAPERTLTLRAGASRVLPVAVDGRLGVQASARVTLSAGGRVLARGRGRVSAAICGQRHVRVTVGAARGGARASVRVRVRVP